MLSPLTPDAFRSPRGLNDQLQKWTLERNSSVDANAVLAGSRRGSSAPGLEVLTLQLCDHRVAVALKFADAIKQALRGLVGPRARRDHGESVEIEEYPENQPAAGITSMSFDCWGGNAFWQHDLS